MYLGSISCISLYFFEGDNVEYGIILSVLASIGFTGSLVFYNAFLPEISTPNNFDKISARGYSFGYVGSVILLIICLILIQSFDFFGFYFSSFTPFAGDFSQCGSNHEKPLRKCYNLD